MFRLKDASRGSINIIIYPKTNVTQSMLVKLRLFNMELITFSHKFKKSRVP